MQTSLEKFNTRQGRKNTLARLWGFQDEAEFWYEALRGRAVGAKAQVTPLIKTNQGRRRASQQLNASQQTP